MEEIKKDIVKLDGKLDLLNEEINIYKNILAQLYKKLKEYAECRKNCPLKSKKRI